MAAPLLSLLLGYLLGSIPFGLLLTRLAARATCAHRLRQYRRHQRAAHRPQGAGRATLLLDALKGTAAVLLVRALWPGPERSLRRAGALLGHLYPVWLRSGRQGRRDLLRHPDRRCTGRSALIYAAVWIGLLLLSAISSVAGMARRSARRSRAALLGRFDLPCSARFRLLVVWKHRANLARLRAGTEPRVGRQAKDA
jgi:glycerol-3-phosphate acyltransferase PlsY